MGLGIDSHPDQLIQFLLHFWITTREKAPLEDKNYKVSTIVKIVKGLNPGVISKVG